MSENKEYKAPEMQIITLKNIDVITTSGSSRPNDGFSRYYSDPYAL